MLLVRVSLDAKNTIGFSKGGLSTAHEKYAIRRYHGSMTTNLNDILDRFAKELGTWLDSPSEASGRIETLRKEMEHLRGQLGAENINSALKAFDDADKQLKRQRQKEAAEAIAEVLHPLGIRLKAETPLKKQRRRKASGTNNRPAGSTDDKPSSSDSSGNQTASKN